MKDIKLLDKSKVSSDDTLLLRTNIGLIFFGFWDDDSGYFFVDELLNVPITEEQINFVNNMELPGRLYGSVIEYESRSGI